MKKNNPIGILETAYFCGFVPYRLIAGMILGCIGVACAILCPTQRRIGWAFLWLAGLCAIGWMVLEFRDRQSPEVKTMAAPIPLKETPQSKPKADPKAKQFDSFLSSKHARMRVTSMEGARSDVFPYITSVTSSNAGGAAADEVAGWWKAVPAITGNDVDDKTIRSYQDELLRSPELTSRFAEGMLNYFLSADPNKRIYVLYVVVFRDRLMPSNVGGVTEYCGWLLGNQSAVHDCGRSRSFLEEFTR